MTSEPASKKRKRSQPHRTADPAEDVAARVVGTNANLMRFLPDEAKEAFARVRDIVGKASDEASAIIYAKTETHDTARLIHGQDLLAQAKDALCMSMLLPYASKDPAFARILAELQGAAAPGADKSEATPSSDDRKTS